VSREPQECGAEGSVRLCCARAFGPYILGLAAVAVGFGVAGEGAVAAPAVALLRPLRVFANLADDLCRTFGAAVEGRAIREDVMP
jgi:hypothetical protein